VLNRGGLHLVPNNDLGGILDIGKSVLPRQGPDRRLKKRFQIALPIRCRELSGTSGVVGNLHDISSKGLAFICSEVLTSGAKVELWIAWPFPLSETSGLQLKGFGHVAK
jgi:hypothetical protein